MIPLVSSHVQALGGSHVYVGLMGSMYSGFQLGSGPLIVITLCYYHIFTFHSTHGHHRALNLHIIFIDPRFKPGRYNHKLYRYNHKETLLLTDLGVP